VRLLSTMMMLSCLVLLAFPVNGFVTPLRTYSRLLVARFDGNHYDDFDFVIGDEQGSAPPERLQELVRQVQQEHVRKDAQLAKNWKMGNWKVRGFSLDKYDATQDLQEETPSHARRVGGSDASLDNIAPEEAPATVHVSRVHSSLTPNQVVVGRTDGSVCFVTLGTQYLTQFIGKLTAKETGNATIAIQSELVRSEDMMLSEESQDETPFHVDRQFLAHDSSIVALATAENHEIDQHLLFTAAEGIGEIRVWGLPDEPEAKVIPLHTLGGAHTDTVVALTTLALSPDEEDNLLFSASKDGSVALWDLQTGDLVYKCQMVQEDEPCTILCADVDPSRSIIYLGMASGHVVGYKVEDLVECAGEGETCPLPSGRFLAHEGGVTAVKCAGEGTLARSNPGASSSILLTGGADGVVKQWYVE